MFRLANDKWNSRQGFLIPFDKAEHCLGSFFLAFVLSLFLPLNQAAGLTLLLGFLWEVKDGFFP